MPLGIAIYLSILVHTVLGLHGDAGATIGGLGQELVFLLGVVFWVRRVRREPLHVLATPTRPIGDLFLGIGIGVLVLFASGITQLVTRSIVKGIFGHVPVPPAATDSVRGAWIAPGVILIVLLAPLGEEILFRGWLFQGLRRRFSFRKAAAISSAMFAWAHVYPINMPGIFVAGLLLANVYERRRSLLASMAAHATLNTVVVIAALAKR